MADNAFKLFDDNIRDAERMARHIGPRAREIHQRYITRRLTAAIEAAMSLPYGNAAALIRLAEPIVKKASKSGVDFKLPPLLDPVEADTAYRIGEAAFEGISGRLSDSMNGTKSAPDWPRCPYRLPMKAKLWREGFNDRLRAFERSMEADAA